MDRGHFLDIAESQDPQVCESKHAAGGGRKGERGARYVHKRLFYCVNVNRTSLDHLLLGKNADVDKNVA
jgi:hypothetical protein